MKQNKITNTEAAEVLLGNKSELNFFAQRSANSLQISQQSLSKADIRRQVEEVTLEPPLIPNLEKLAAEIENISTMNDQTAAFDVNPSAKV